MPARRPLGIMTAIVPAAREIAARQSLAGASSFANAKDLLRHAPSTGQTLHSATTPIAGRPGPVRRGRRGFPQLVRTGRHRLAGLCQRCRLARACQSGPRSFRTQGNRRASRRGLIGPDSRSRARMATKKAVHMPLAPFAAAERLRAAETHIRVTRLPPGRGDPTRTRHATWPSSSSIRSARRPGCTRRRALWPRAARFPC